MTMPHMKQMQNKQCPLVARWLWATFPFQLQVKQWNSGNRKYCFKINLSTVHRTSFPNIFGFQKEQPRILFSHDNILKKCEVHYHAMHLELQGGNNHCSLSWPQCPWRFQFCYISGSSGLFLLHVSWIKYYYHCNKHKNY